MSNSRLLELQEELSDIDRTGREREGSRQAEGTGSIASA